MYSWALVTNVGTVIAETTPIIVKVTKTSASVNAFLYFEGKIDKKLFKQPAGELSLQNQLFWRFYLLCLCHIQYFSNTIII